MALAKLTEDEEATLRKAFMAFDANRNETMESGELKALLRSVGQHPTDIMIQDMIRDADKNGNGTIELPEFLWVMAQPENRRHKAWHAHQQRTSKIAEVWASLREDIVAGRVREHPHHEGEAPDTPRSATAATFAKTHPYAVMGTVTEQQSAECSGAIKCLVSGKTWKRGVRNLDKVSHATFTELLTIAETNPCHVLHGVEKAAEARLDRQAVTTQALHRALEQADVLKPSPTPAHPELPPGPLAPLGPASGLIVRQAHLMAFPKSCTYEEAIHKYAVDRRMDAAVAAALGEDAMHFDGLRACIYAHIRVGYGDLGAAVTNACFLRSMGVDAIVAMGGNYQGIPDKIRKNFEDALGAPVHAGVEDLAKADFDAHLLFDTYTPFAADGDIMGPVLKAVGGRAKRMSLAEFGFSSLQDWGPRGEAPELFSMGIGPLDLGIPISAPLRRSLELDGHALTPAKLAELRTADPITRAALANGLPEGQASDAGYVESRKLFCGYAHLPVNVINFVVIAASVAALEDKSVGEGVSRKHVDVVVGKSPRVTTEALVAMLRSYGKTFRRWFDRVELQTPAEGAGKDGDFKFETKVVVEVAQPACGGRTLRVINQGVKLGLLLTMAHPFVLGTGDSSLAEIFSAGKVFIYDAMPHKQDTVTSLANLCAELKLSNMLKLLQATAVKPFPYKEALDNISGNPALRTGPDGLALAKLVKAAEPEAKALSDHVAEKLDLAPVKLAKLARMTARGRAAELVERLKPPADATDPPVASTTGGTDTSAEAVLAQPEAEQREVHAMLKKTLDGVLALEKEIYAASSESQTDKLLMEYKEAAKGLNKALHSAQRFDHLREAIVHDHGSVDHAAALHIAKEYYSSKLDFLHWQPVEHHAATENRATIKVSGKKSDGAYMQAAAAMLEEQKAEEALRIEGLGEAVSTAAALASRLEAEGRAVVVRVQTDCRQGPRGSSPQLLVDLRRK